MLRHTILLYICVQLLFYLFLQIEQPELIVASQDLIEGLENENVKEYYSYMVNVATLLGADNTTVEKELLKVIEFEVALAKVRKIYLVVYKVCLTTFCSLYVSTFQ